MTIMNYGEWLNGIGGRATLGADAHLNGIDDALRAYCTGDGRLPAHAPELLAKLEAVLDAWHQAQAHNPGLYGALANWQAAGFVVADLYRQVKGPTRTPDDVARLALERDAREARVAVLYLFSNLRVSAKFASDIASTLLSGVRLGLDLAGDIHKVNAPFHEAGMTGSTTRYLQDKIAGFALVKPATTLETAGHALWREHVLPQSSDAAAEADAEASTGGLAVREIVLNFIKRIWSAVTDFIRKAVGTAWAESKDFVWQFVGQPELIVQEMAEVFIRQVLPTLVPIWGAAKTLSASLRGLFDTVVEPIVRRLKLGDVHINAGFAQSVVSGIGHGNVWMAGNHVYATIQGIAGAVLSAVASPAVGVVNLIAGIAGNVAKICYRFWERSMLRAFCKEARQHFEAGRYQSNDFTGSADALPNDRDAFERWFKPYARWVPSISSLTLTSGICGTPYVYVSLLRPDGQIISANSFIKGTDYLTALKAQAKRYLGQNGLVISYRSEHVKAYLERGKNRPKDLSHAGEKLTGLVDRLKQSVPKATA